MNQAFELRHGRSLKVFMMDKVSNGPFLEVKMAFWQSDVRILLNVLIIERV
jgi:hypothetical protein